jgi:hypothetical protein
MDTQVKTRSTLLFPKAVRARCDHQAQGADDRRCTEVAAPIAPAAAPNTASIRTYEDDVGDFEYRPCASQERAKEAAVVPFAQSAGAKTNVVEHTTHQTAVANGHRR